MSGDEGKRDEAGRLAHMLKGVARTLEAAEWGDAAFAGENALRSGDLPNVETLIKSMEEVLAPAITTAASLEIVSSDRKVLVLLRGQWWALNVRNGD